MEAFKRLVLCSTAVLVFSAQTPAPSPAPIVAIPMKTTRHLVYSFTVAYHSSGEAHNSGMSSASGGNGSGVITTFGGGGRHGTINADIVAMTTDNGLVVQITEVVEQAARQDQTHSCVVYGDGRLSCSDMARAGNSDMVIGPTDVEGVLLGFLGRGFIDAANMDANNHWKNGYSNAESTLDKEFTMTDAGDGKPAVIIEASHYAPHNQSLSNVSEDIRLSYDRALSVPVQIHDDKHETGGNQTVLTTIDLTLAKDSFAHQ